MVFEKTKAILITGKPGCGKTTLLRRAVAESGVAAGGFYTEEVREHGERQGFRIVTLDGRSAVLSYVGIRSPYRVGRYGVDLVALESVAVPAIYGAIAWSEVVVI
ncbi:MAG: AAA family ATPase, partial [Dehalococcoidia bacterium]|nr:AAA family ATPase [Dehalococcoidia bacterium]